MERHVGARDGAGPVEDLQHLGGAAGDEAVQGHLGLDGEHAAINEHQDVQE